MEAARGRASFSAQRVVDALAFIVVTVALAKASQYAAVSRIGPAIGFDAASLLGAGPVVTVAAIMQRRRRRLRTTAFADYSTR
ncbi:hypothetical protein HRV97_01985 [Sphingomonas sp. HHU CXW]|uniref:Uncharacterized protein n=1 Tax=Sphingomonas hominis TaxID=2741495 RepID=A0ABX2JEU9_9SPHN|nr:hypothetical protein [Sphingomonas hominis]NTS63931.1 hypothetical protein [Sphingomonas hominis]